MKSVGLKLTAIMVCVILLGIAITLSIAVTISGNAIIKESLGKVQKSNIYETVKLDKWLSDQVAGVSSLAEFFSSMDELADVLTADQTGYSLNLEDQASDTVRPPLKVLLDENPEYFETYIGFLDGSAVTGSGYEFDYSWWSAPQRGWYQLALTDTSCAHITSPYVDAQTGQLCISAVRAVINRDELVGVVGADIFVAELQDMTLSATMDSTGFSMLVDSNGDIFIHPDSDYAPDDNGDFRNLNTVKNSAYSEMWKTVSSSDDIHKFPDADGTPHYYNACALSTTGWYLIAVLPSKVVTQPIINVLMLVIPIALVILLLAALLIFLTIRNVITRPIAPLTAFMKRAGATGDISINQEESSVLGKCAQVKDEIGQCISASTAFVGRVTNVSQALESMASNDLTSELAPLSDKDTLGLSLQQMTGNLNDMFAEIRISTSQVSTGSKQVADGAQMLAQASTEQAASVEELSGSIAELAERTKANALMAEKTSSLSDIIRGNAEKGSRQMGEMIDAVKEINQASQNIGKVIKAIDDIAFQTNILALNAAVEAARAGQHGKGFAVVADEVRNLAAKSAEAAKETNDMIQNSMDKAVLGSRIANETATSLTEIVSGINESSSFISEIAKSSDEQSDGISQINIGIDQIAQVVQQNSATAEESAATSEEMNSQANILENLMSQFKLRNQR